MMKVPLDCFVCSFSMCASGSFTFESVWNIFFFKKKILNPHNHSYLHSYWEQSPFSLLLFFLVYLCIVIF